MKYNIEIDYSTGNTFGLHDEIRIIEDLIFEDIESAKEALQIIKKHKDMTSSVQGYMSDEERTIKNHELSIQPWAVKSNFGGGYNFQFKVRTSKDSGEWVNVYAFWMGYFENLNEARIINADADSDLNEMSISFR